MTKRRIDYGKVALVLSIIIIGIFAIDFCRRLWHKWSGENGVLHVTPASSHVESMSDSSAAAPVSGDDSGIGSDDSQPDDSTGSEVYTGDAESVQISSDSIHTGSLILVDGTHPLVGTPDCSAFSTFDYAHLRLASTALTVNNMTTGAITSWFTAFYNATAHGDVMVYSTTENYKSASYTELIPERPTGLSLDLGILNEAAGSHTPLTGEGDYAWLSAHAAEYGYVLRYPADKTEQTGQPGMSWHFRFVGTPHALYMTENNLCLEEYLTLVQSHPWEGEHLTFTAAGVNYEVYYVPASTGSAATEVFFPAGAEPQISGDNVGGFIVTCVRT